MRLRFAILLAGAIVLADTDASAGNKPIYASDTPKQRLLRSETSVDVDAEERQPKLFEIHLNFENRPMDPEASLRNIYSELIEMTWNKNINKFMEEEFRILQSLLATHKNRFGGILQEINFLREFYGEIAILKYITHTKGQSEYINLKVLFDDWIDKSISVSDVKKLHGEKWAAQYKESIEDRINNLDEKYEPGKVPFEEYFENYEDIDDYKKLIK